jgi:hypothetical protein
MPAGSSISRHERGTRYADQTQCNEPYAENDVISILPTVPTDLARLNLRIKTLREKGLTHALKKAPGSKKRKKNADKETNGGAESNGTAAAAKSKSSSDEDKKAKPKANGVTASESGLKNSATASLTRKVMEEQEERNKRRKLGQNAAVKSLFNTSSSKPSAGNSADYMTRGFSIGKK